MNPVSLLVSTTKCAKAGPWKPFLKGPVPWAWLCAAMILPGKATAVGLRLWFLAGLRRSSVAVPLNLCLVGVDRSAASRGLAALERAGLVSVRRGKGRKALVTIIVNNLNKSPP